ncbi:MAG: polysaccharide deacetylase family protein [Gammaproteobacteria bacterium]|nr:polysaccharide deacetylase family protein [Gammaproteobacteria bacterium]
MVSKKRLLINFLSPFALGIMSLKKRGKRENDKLIILAYHGIDDVDLEKYPLSNGNITATTDQFEAQLKLIKRNFNVLTFKKLHEEYLLEGRFPERGLIITFDDGYRNNYTHAFPILKKYNLPATIFLATEYIDSNKKFWFDELCFKIFQSEKESLGFAIEDKLYSFDISDYKAKRDSDLKVKRILKKISNRERLKILNEIYLNLEPIKVDKEQKRYVLNWDEIKEMSENGIEFGSHAKSHPILSKQTYNEVKNEIFDSKKDIEERLGECIVFSYPNGGKSDFGEREMCLLKEAGYKYAVNYIQSNNNKAILNYYSLNRLHVELEVDIKQFQTGLIWPKMMF